MAKLLNIIQGQTSHGNSPCAPWWVPLVDSPGGPLVPPGGPPFPGWAEQPLLPGAALHRGVQLHRAQLLRGVAQRGALQRSSGHSW